MRTLFVSEFISLDGVIEAPGGEAGYQHTGWTFDIEEDPAVYEYKGRELAEATALLVGRTTYEGFAAAWPERDGEFAARFNTMPKYAVSTTLTDPAWSGTEVLRDVDAVARFRQGEGGPIMVNGSGTLVRALYAAGLVDEWRLMTWPLVLGSGARLFPDHAEDKQKLTHVDTTTYANGIQLHVYRPLR